LRGLPKIFEGEHFFEIKPLSNGKTVLINREEYRGILSLLMKNLPMMKHENLPITPDQFRVLTHLWQNDGRGV